jgi:hypothetical protein
LISLTVAGAVLVLAGLGGLVHCIRQGHSIRGAGLPPEEIRARLHKLIAINLASVAGAAIGLALVVVGLLF